MRVLALLIALAAVAPVARAETSTCAPCTRLLELKNTIRGVKPDAENKRTIEKQEAFLEAARPLILEAVGEKPRELTSAQWAPILPLMAFVALYDPDHTVARALLPKFGPDAEFFYEVVSKAERARSLTETEGGEIRVSFLTAEAWILDEANPPKL